MKSEIRADGALVVTPESAADDAALRAFSMAYADRVDEQCEPPKEQPMLGILRFEFE